MRCSSISWICFFHSISLLQLLLHVHASLSSTSTLLKLTFLLLNHSNNHDCPVTTVHAKKGTVITDDKDDDDYIPDTAIPFTSLSPSSAPSDCYDLPGWFDAQGDDCSWYSIDQRCFVYGNQWKKDGFTANMACCDCSGGFQLADEFAPTMSPSTPEPTASLECFDKPDFIDAEGLNCQDYEREVDDDDAFFHGLNRCDLNGEEFGANDSCCFCGGGFTWPYIPSASPSSTHSPTSRAPTPQPTSSSCKNIAGWYDSFGETCESFYARPLINSTETRCSKYGDSAMRFGYTARSACCTCSGGVKVEDSLRKPLTNVSLRPMNPLLDKIGEPCIDIPNWKDRSELYTCSKFSFKSNEDFVTCDQYEHVQSNKGESAKDSCCICGGGYNGTLIGRTFRVSFPADSDSNYTLFSYTSSRNSVASNSESRKLEVGNRKSGSILEFMYSLAEEAGFGMYEQSISEESLKRYPNSTYDACLYDLLMAKTDICMGPFWKIDQNSGYSQSLFSDTFYLVVPETKVDFLTLLLTPFASFRWDAWLGIFFVAFYMGFVIDIIHNNGFRNNSTSFWLRCCNTFYHSLTSFTSGEVSNATDDSESVSAEKVVIASFAVFGLIILTAYTATSAAFLVSSAKGYNSLVDVIEDDAVICTQSRVSIPFVDSYPQVFDLVRPTAYTTKELLDKIGSNECDAVLVSRDAFLASRSCGSHKFLKDEVLLTLENVLPTMELLGDWGFELKSVINKRIADGSYMKIHSTMKIDQDDAPECTSVSSENSELVQLTFFHLLAPFVMSIVFTTAGLLMFLSNRKRTLRLKEIFSKIVGMSLKDTESDELILLQIRAKSSTDIIKELSDLDVPKEDLVEAINNLPSREMLEHLIFHHKCSNHRRDFDIINVLTTSELCTVLGACDRIVSNNSSDDIHPKTDEEMSILLSNETLPEFMNNLCGNKIYEDILNNETDPKAKLIEYIISKPIPRRLALYCGRTKMNSILRSSTMIDNFDINLLLFGDNDTYCSENSIPDSQRSLAVHSSGYNIMGLKERRRKALLFGIEPNQSNENLPKYT